jgi:hypothetical protein
MSDKHWRYKIKNTVALFSDATYAYAHYAVLYIEGMSGCDQKVPLRNLPHKPHLPLQGGRGTVEWTQE